MQFGIKLWQIDGFSFFALKMTVFEQTAKYSRW